MSLVVLDASASVDLLLDTNAGRALQKRLPERAEWWVPEHFYVEVGAVLRRAEARGLAPKPRVANAFAEVLSAPLRRVQVRPLLPDAWARRGNLTLSDALYVVLAQHLGATLVTSDKKLAGAPDLGVSTIYP